MRQAIELAQQAGRQGDVPVGALVIRRTGDSGQIEILGCGYNRREQDSDPCAHAEIEALREAGKALGSWRLDNCELYVTLEPCTMCAGAIVSARIKRLVFGAWDAKAGAAGSVRDVVRDRRLNHQVEVYGGVLEDDCAALLRRLFRN